jgi:hypothetical protein
MEAFINQGKSKSYNLMLRYLQDAIILIIIIYIDSTPKLQCSTQAHGLMNMLQYFTIGVIILTFISLIYIYCKDRFARAEFFISYFVNTVLFIAIIVFGFITMTANYRECV